MASPGLLGRDAELGVLAELIEQVSERGTAIVVLGEAGIGKSALLRAVAGLARSAGFQVLKTSGVETEANLPFAGLHQLTRPVLGLADALPATQRRALFAAFGDDEGPGAEPFLIALAALNLLAEASAQRPVLVAVDDVQWLDRPTHEALTFISRRVSHDPIVIIGTVRKGHAGPFTTAGLAELDVPGLDDVSARGVLQAHGSGLSFADRERILRAALGNPLALVELPGALRAAAQPAPEPIQAVLPLTARLERAFAGRLAELPPLTRDAVIVAAVDSVNELPEILAAASVLAGQAVRTGDLDSASAAGLIRFDELHVRFRHPLGRSGVLQGEPVARRQAANAALAAVLADDPYRRTWHRAQSIIGPDNEVADELEASHTVALRRGSVMSAIWALERSAQLTTDQNKRGRRLLLAAEHSFGLGRADMVDRLLRAAERNSLSDLDRARIEWLREIFNDGVPGDAVRVLELCDIAERSARAGDADLALNLLLGAALRCWWADTGPNARARVVTVTEQLQGSAEDPRYAAALAVAEPILRGRAVIGMLSQMAIEKVTDADALRLLGMAAHAVGHSVRAADFLDRSETRLRDQGRLGLLPHVLGMQIQVRLALGDWERAAAAAAEGHHLAEETGQPIWTTGTLVGEAMADGLRGDSERALELAAQAQQAAGRQSLNDLLACARLARSYAWISGGRYAEGYQELLPLFDPADPSYHQRESFGGVMFLAEAAIHADRGDDARAVIAGLEQVAAVTPSPILRVHLRYAQAVLADDADAEDLYRAALGEELTRWPWARARIELAYGGWLRRQRRAAESRAPLRAALTTLDLIGATSWADQARAELRAAGESVAAVGPAAQDTLSARELQIARLVAKGLSNREIGQRLFLSPRTIGSHLYRIYPKLDITSRTQLATRLDSS